MFQGSNDKETLMVGNISETSGWRKIKENSQISNPQFINNLNFKQLLQHMYD